MKNFFKLLSLTPEPSGWIDVLSSKVEPVLSARWRIHLFCCRLWREEVAWWSIWESNKQPWTDWGETALSMDGCQAGRLKFNSRSFFFFWPAEEAKGSSKTGSFLSFVCLIIPGGRNCQIIVQKAKPEPYSTWMQQQQQQQRLLVGMFWLIYSIDYPADPARCSWSRMRTHCSSADFLHWLTRKPRKGLKVNLLSYKVLRSQAPSYLEEPIAPDHPNGPLLSEGAAVLVVPRIFKSRLGGRL